MAPEGKVNVVEATNDATKERYVTLTSLPVEVLRGVHQRTLPSRLAHWKLEEADYRLVEGALDPLEARDFAERYIEIMRLQGWRTIADLPQFYRTPEPFQHWA